MDGNATLATAIVTDQIILRSPWLGCTKLMMCSARCAHYKRTEIGSFNVDPIMMYSSDIPESTPIPVMMNGRCVNGVANSNP